MASRFKMYAVAAACLGATVIAGGVILARAPRPTTPSLPQVLERAPIDLVHHLYPGGLDPDSGRPLAAKDRGDEVSEPLGVGTRVLYLTFKDRSTEDIFTKADGKLPASSQSYYRVQPGEIGRRPHVKRIYAADKDVIVDEEVRHLDGSIQERSHTDANAARHVLDYSDDGSIVIGEQWFVTPKDCCMGPTLKSEQHWRTNAQHTLSYNNIFNDDETRTITDYDEQENPVKVAHWSKYSSPAGSTVTAYYPGTNKVRLDSASDYYVDTVKYYRPDGTLSHIAKISASSTTLDFFDSTGTKLILTQDWWRKDDRTGAQVKSTYTTINNLTEYDAKGEKTRDISFMDGAPHYEEIFHVTTGGVTYVQVDNHYRPDGTVGKTVFWLNQVVYPPEHTEEHSPAENIRITIPADEITLHVQIEDGLPIPIPQHYPY